MQRGKPDTGRRLKERYGAMVERFTPKSELPRNLMRSFLFGGAICVIGQLILELAKTRLGFDAAEAGTFTSITLIFIGAFLTGIGKYDWIGRRAGAGSIVPITGFANSIVAAAMEFKREGFVMGVGAKMFQIAGPVLVYGIGSSVIAGLAALLFRLI